MEFECFRMLANGCGCSIGDQLHPRGEMNRAAYARIGTVYREIEKLEPFVEGSRKVADIGIVVSTDFFTAAVPPMRGPCACSWSFITALISSLSRMPLKSTR